MQKNWEHFWSTIGAPTLFIGGALFAFNILLSNIFMLIFHTFMHYDYVSVSSVIFAIFTFIVLGVFTLYMLDQKADHNRILEYIFYFFYPLSLASGFSIYRALFHYFGKNINVDLIDNLALERSHSPDLAGGYLYILGWPFKKIYDGIIALFSFLARDSATGFFAGTAQTLQDLATFFSSNPILSGILSNLVAAIIMALLIKRFNVLRTA
jgi:hypothetical protein